MDAQAREVEVGRFFAVAGPTPGNVYIMRVQPTTFIAGTCQNIDNESFWTIEGDRFVRLIAEHEYDQKVFHVTQMYRCIGVVGS